MTGDYEVGYGKPPKSGQIKKGEVRNVRGRPKGEKNLKTLFAREAAEIVTLNVKGKPKRMTKREVAIKALLQAAMKGQPWAFAKMTDLDLRFFDHDDASAGIDQLLAEDQAILAAYERDQS